jgi:hypothetical protein
MGPETGVLGAGFPPRPVPAAEAVAGGPDILSASENWVGAASPGPRSHAGTGAGKNRNTALARPRTLKSKMVTNGRSMPALPPLSDSLPKSRNVQEVPEPETEGPRDSLILFKTRSLSGLSLDSDCLKQLLKAWMTADWVQIRVFVNP